MATTENTVCTELHTYNDLVNRILEEFGELSRAGRHMRLARRAVLRAHRTFPTFHCWSYYERREKITTAASQSTGTIQYDHTGNAKGERVVVLTGATFPTDAALYTLILSQTTYKIQRYIDTTTVQLTPLSNPGADVAAGTSYTLFKSLYDAPVNMRRCSNLIDLSRGYGLAMKSPAGLLAYQAGNYTPSEETCFTVRNAGEYYGALVFELAPPPTRARTYDYAYEAAPRPLKTEKLAGGGSTTVSVTANSTTITASAATFTTDHIGSIIRIASDGNDPSPAEGNLETDNPYAFQRTIMTVTDGTTATIDSVLSTTATHNTKGFLISDPIDVEPHAMYSAFERWAMYYFAQSHLEKGADKYLAMAQQEITAAKIADNYQRDMISEADDGSDKSLWSLRDWAIAEAYSGSAI